MKADGAQTIYFTTDGNTLCSSNCVGRLFGGTNRMYFDYYTNFLFYGLTIADGTNTNSLNIRISYSTFYGRLTTNNITNNGTLSNSGSASFNSVSTTSINYSAFLSQAGPIEIGPNITNFSYIDMKTTSGNCDYDMRIGVTGRISSTSGQGALSFNCASCSIGSDLTVIGNVTCNTLNATTLSF